MSKAHLRRFDVLSDRLELVAAVDADAERAQGATEFIPSVQTATDYRDVLIPILRRHAPDADMARVFPGHEAKPFDQMLEAA